MSFASMIQCLLFKLLVSSFAHFGNIKNTEDKRTTLH